MPRKGLTEKQRRAKELEKIQIFQQQQQSIATLSMPSERNIELYIEKQKEDQMLEMNGSPRRANKGLHLMVEHEVITRDMPDPLTLSMIQKKNAENDFKAWNNQNMSAYEKNDSDLNNTQKGFGQKMQRNDSLEIVTYSRNETLAAKGKSREQTEDSKNSSPMRGNSRVKKNPLDASNRASAQKSVGSKKTSFMNLGNYQESKMRKDEDDREVFARMQSSVVSKEREKNSRSGENKDLPIPEKKRPKKGSIDKQARNTQVAFDDQVDVSYEQSLEQGRLTDKNKTMATTSFATAQQKGILKSQKNKPMDTTNTLMGKSSIDINQQINDGTQLQMLDERSSIDSDTHDSKLIQKNKMQSKFDQNDSVPPSKKNTPKQKDDFNNTSGSNAKKMTMKKTFGKTSNNDDLKIFNTVKVNQRRSGMLYPLPMNQRHNIEKEDKEDKDVPYHDDFDPNPPYVPKKKRAAHLIQPGDDDSDEYGDRSQYLNIGKSSLMDDIKDDMDRKMLALVYKYTRPEVDLETGQQKKINKLDLSSIKERGINREKVKYEQYEIYKSVTDKMTFRDEVFDQNINVALDPKKSPLIPALYTRQELEQQRLQKEIQNNLAKDPYTTKIASIDDFVGKPDLTHKNTLAKMNPLQNNLKSKLSHLKELQQRGQMLRQQQNSTSRDQSVEGQIIIKENNSGLASDRNSSPELTILNDLIDNNDAEMLDLQLIIEETDEQTIQNISKENQSREHDNSVQISRNVGFMPEHLNTQRIASKLLTQRQNSKIRMSRRGSKRIMSLDSSRNHTQLDNHQTITTISKDLTSSQQNTNLVVESDDEESPAQPGYTNEMDNDQEKFTQQEMDEEIDEQELYKIEDIQYDDAHDNQDEDSKLKKNEQDHYNIRNHPKLKKDRKKEQNTEGLDAKKRRQIQDKLNSDRKEEMRQSEKVFKMIHDYCKENLEVSYNMLDKHIEDLLDPNCTVSPLLKYFNLLAKDSNFRLPCRTILEFDQKFFKKYINRLRGAQQVEIKWVRKTIVDESRKTLFTSFNQARTLLQDEIKTILYNFDDLKGKLTFQEDENAVLKRKIIELENTIVEQKHYVSSVISKNWDNDHELFVLNGGPGGAYEKYNEGVVIQNIDAYHEAIRQSVEDASRELRNKMHDDHMESVVQDRMKDQMSKMKSYLQSQVTHTSPSDSNRESEQFTSPFRSASPDPTVKVVKNEGQGKPSLAVDSLLNLIQANDNKSDMKSALLGSISPNKSMRGAKALGEGNSMVTLKKPAWVNYNSYVPPIEECWGKLEPFLKNPLHMFGGQIKLHMQDVQQLMSEEMYKYHKIEIKNLLEKIEGLKADNYAISVTMNELNISNDSLQTQNDKMRFEIAEYKRKLQQHTQLVNKEAELRIAKVKDEAEQAKQLVKSFLGLEIKVATAIKDKMISQNEFQAEKLRKFATLLRIPRLHFEYIEKHGVNEFVDYCEDIVKRERAQVEIDQAMLLQANARNKASIIKHVNSRDDYTERLFHDRKQVYNKSPFALSVLNDLRRADHYTHDKAVPTKKELENQKILDQLEKIEWLKNKSMLDLSELIRKHQDRQPQLFSILQPGIKKQLLHNPTLIKSLEAIEHQDPVNKRAAEIKKFLQLLNADKYERKHLFKTIDDEVLQENNIRLMSKSMVLGKDPWGMKTPKIKNLNLRNSFAQTDDRRKSAVTQIETRLQDFGSDANSSMAGDDTIIIQVNTDNKLSHTQSTHNSPKSKTLKKYGRNVTYSNTITHDGIINSGMLSPKTPSKRQKYRQAYLAKSMILRNGFTSVQEEQQKSQEKRLDYDVSSIGTEELNTKWQMFNANQKQSAQGNDYQPVSLAAQMGLNDMLTNQISTRQIAAQFRMNLREKIEPQIQASKNRYQSIANYQNNTSAMDMNRLRMNNDSSLSIQQQQQYDQKPAGFKQSPMMIGQSLAFLQRLTASESSNINLVDSAMQKNVTHQSNITAEGSNAQVTMPGSSGNLQNINTFSGQNAQSGQFPPVKKNMFNSNTAAKMINQTSSKGEIFNISSIQSAQMSQDQLNLKNAEVDVRQSQNLSIQKTNLDEENEEQESFS